MDYLIFKFSQPGHVYFSDLKSNSKPFVLKISLLALKWYFRSI